MNKINNDLINEMCKKIIKLIEKHKNCRVLKCSYEFVEDFQGKIFLLNTSECMIVVSTDEARRPVSPLDFKLSRAIGIAEAQRVAREERTKNDKDNALYFDSPLKSLHDKSSARSGRAGSGRDRTAVTPLPKGNFEARLWDEGRSADASILGSTQLSSLCKGDFCTYNISALENIDVRTGSRGTGDNPTVNQYDRLSNFRRNLMEMDTDKAATTAAVSGTPVGVPLACSRKIGMGAIIQARQETVLVDLQLKRHRTGDTGDYVSTEGQLDSASVSGKLPAHYYQEVPICETCFLVYKVRYICFFWYLYIYLSLLANSNFSCVRTKSFCNF